ncbi:hypothetical protein CWE13_10450 [Aliidiomarina shirensis]|uniref:Uncharacterized protein n=1 Tax=Aliidiomarina shirensis TaxID=1048642 RepID=A0A432WQK2_9GAMM|nr:hypothetical protein CWE13_10450 [Aliidiomarina shirensis]
MIYGLILTVFSIWGLILYSGRSDILPKAIVKSIFARFVKGNKFMAVCFVLLLMVGLMNILDVI